MSRPDRWRIVKLPAMVIIDDDYLEFTAAYNRMVEISKNNHQCKLKVEAYRRDRRGEK